MATSDPTQIYTSLTATTQILDTLNKIGPFLSSIALIAAAVAAWATFFVFHKKTLELQIQQKNEDWLKGFRLLYAEFWKDDKIALVRKWITSEEEYKIINEILSKRLECPDNLLSSDDNDKLEKIDRFCSIIVRITSFSKSEMNEAQKELWNRMFGDFWFDKIKSRTELVDYAKIYWPRLLGDDKDDK